MNKQVNKLFYRIKILSPVVDTEAKWRGSGVCAHNQCCYRKLRSDQGSTSKSSTGRDPFPPATGKIFRLKY